MEPRPGGVSLMCVAGRPEIQRLVNSDLVFVSDPWLPQLVRQKALQADVSVTIIVQLYIFSVLFFCPFNYFVV